MSKILAHRYNIVSNMRRYRKQLQKFILLFYLLFLSPHHKYLALFVFSLISVFSIPLPQHANHQRPPLDAADLAKATTWRHRSFVFSILLWVLFFLFFFFSFLFTFFGCGLMCGLGNEWVWMGRLVVGGFEWADCCPPRSTVHLTLSDRRSLMLIFVFFGIFVFLW